MPQQAKELIIKVLSQFNKPIKFKAIHSALDQTYPERTLRRWLNELCEQGTVIKSGVKKGTVYQINKNSISNTFTNL